MATGEKVLGRRAGAALIDLVPLSVVGVLLGDTSTESGFSVELEGTPFLLWLAVVFAYYIGTEAAQGATPGKLAMGLRVSTEDGGAPATSQVVLRNVFRIIDALPVLYFVGFVTAAITEHDQRVGDLVAKTRVVRSG